MHSFYLPKLQDEDIFSFFSPLLSFSSQVGRFSKNEEISVSAARAGSAVVLCGVIDGHLRFSSPLCFLPVHKLGVFQQTKKTETTKKTKRPITGKWLTWHCETHTPTHVLGGPPCARQDTRPPLARRRLPSRRRSRPRRTLNSYSTV